MLLDFTIWIVAPFEVQQMVVHLLQRLAIASLAYSRRTAPIALLLDIVARFYWFD